MTHKPETSADEQAYFAKRAALWWNKEGPFWPLIRLNKFRIPYIIEQVCQATGRVPSAPQPLQGLSILDVGCGGGLVSEALAHAGAQVTGIDIVEANIRTAQAHAAASGTHVTYIAGDVHKAQTLGETYDIILTLEVVEHVDDPSEHLSMLADLLRPSGIIFVSTINRTIMAYIFAILGAEYILRLLPKGTHHWSKFVTPTEVAQVFKQAGLTCLDTCGVKLNVLNRKFRKSGSVSVNYMTCWQKK